MAQSFEHFDERIANGLIRANSVLTGLPKFLNAQIVKVTPGQLTATVEVRDDLITPLGTLHGGVMAGLIDHVLGCVLYPLMPQGYWAATTEFKLNYLSPVRKGTLVAEATVVALTKRTAVVKVEVSNDGQLACMAQGTVLIVAPPSK
jgi:uncharacterized protein (TIGR00369 family)